MTDFSAPEFTRYAAAHKTENGPGDARPTAHQIVKDEGLEGKLADKVILITGCSSGIGIDTARAMKATGAHIYATARDKAKGEKALADILEPGKLDLMLLDLNSLASVRSFADEFLEKTGGKLNIMINNAGVMATPEGKTADGFETQFGTNHLAHFLLFQLLKPALLSSSMPSFNSRVISVSSVAHRYNPINFDNIMLDGEYERNKAYAHSKIANIYFANEVERRYGSRGLHALSLHPGGISTGLQVHVSDMVEMWNKDPKVAGYMKSPEQGAATQVWGALAKCFEGAGGVYLENCQVSPPLKEGASLLEHGYAKWAYNKGNEERLWKMSNKFVGLEEDE